MPRWKFTLDTAMPPCASAYIAWPVAYASDVIDGS
jgi:hypothetical protein